MCWLSVKWDENNFHFVFCCFFISYLQKTLHAEKQSCHYSAIVALHVKELAFNLLENVEIILDYIYIQCIKQFGLCANLVRSYKKRLTAYLQQAFLSEWCCARVSNTSSFQWHFKSVYDFYVMCFFCCWYSVSFHLNENTTKITVCKLDQKMPPCKSELLYLLKHDGYYSNSSCPCQHSTYCIF